MEHTKIQWATHTFNPWEGCSKVSPGCANCYAAERAHRLKSSEWGPRGTRVVRSESYWRDPLKWNALAGWCGNPVCVTPGWKEHIRPGKCACGLDVSRPRVFCASVGDVFEEWTGPMTAPSKAGFLHRSTDGWCVSAGVDQPRMVTMQDVRRRLFALIDATPGLDWLLVTKRPENIIRFTPARDLGPRQEGEPGTNPDWSFWRDNVWHIASVEDQPTADDRIPELLKVRSACLGLSMEPLLGRVRLRQTFADGSYRDYLTGQFHNMNAKGVGGNPDFVYTTNDPRLPKLGWVIVGGESGRHARQTNVDAILGVVRQCQKAGTPVFVKQLGKDPYVPITGSGPLAFPGGTRFDLQPDRISLRLADDKGGNPAEWPENLQLRESPRPVDFHRVPVGA